MDELRKTFDFIVQFTLDEGYTPSYRQIVSGTQARSTSTVARHVRRLAQLGYLKQPRPFALIVVGMEMRFYGDRP